MAITIDLLQGIQLAHQSLSYDALTNRAIDNKNRATNLSGIDQFTAHIKASAQTGAANIGNWIHGLTFRPILGSGYSFYKMDFSQDQNWAEFFFKNHAVIIDQPPTQISLLSVSIYAISWIASIAIGILVLLKLPSPVLEGLLTPPPDTAGSIGQMFYIVKISMLCACFVVPKNITATLFYYVINLPLLCVGGVLSFATQVISCAFGATLGVLYGLSTWSPSDPAFLPGLPHT